MLRGWQERAGRHQLYDNLAVIEFGEDMHPEEVKVIAGLGPGKFYPVSPRCLDHPHPGICAGPGG